MSSATPLRSSGKPALEALAKEDSGAGALCCPALGAAAPPPSEQLSEQAPRPAVRARIHARRAPGVPCVARARTRAPRPLAILLHCSVERSASVLQNSAPG